MSLPRAEHFSNGCKARPYQALPLLAKAKGLHNHSPLSCFIFRGYLYAFFGLCRTDNRLGRAFGERIIVVHRAVHIIDINHAPDFPHPVGQQKDANKIRFGDFIGFAQNGHPVSLGQGQHFLDNNRRQIMNDGKLRNKCLNLTAAQIRKHHVHAQERFFVLALGRGQRDFEG